MDKVKGLLKGREKQAKSGIDTLSDQVEKRAGKHAGTVDDISDKAKAAVDKLAGSDAPAAAPAAGPAPAAPPAAGPAPAAPPAPADPPSPPVGGPPA
jgi:hypothetical protein